MATEMSNELRRIAETGVWFNHLGSNLLVDAADEIERLQIAADVDCETLRSAQGVGLKYMELQEQSVQEIARLREENEMLDLSCEHLSDMVWARDAEIERLRAENVELREGACRLQQRCNVMAVEFDRVIGCLDQVFQSVSGVAPLLPDFLLAGECKAEGTVKLAHAYIERGAEIERLRADLAELDTVMRNLAYGNITGHERQEIARECVRMRKAAQKAAGD